MHTNFVLLCVPKRGKLRSLKVLSLLCLKVDDLGLKRRRRVVARRSCGAAAEKFREREECGQIVFCAKVEHIRTGAHYFKTRMKFELNFS